MNFLKNVFAKLHTTSDSAKAAEQLNSGKSIIWKPQSNRYTYDNQYDTNYDKDWKPETAEEKETLSPEGYFRVGEKTKEKNSLLDGIYKSALNIAKKDNPTLSDSEQKEIASKEANKIFDEQYEQRQISIPSTALSSVQYDPKTGGLTVRFTSSNKDYYYPEVPEELVEALLKAPSKGEFFMKNIHDQYTLNPGHKPSGNIGKGNIRKEIKRVSSKINKGKWSK